ncbi:uncharacterized protein Cpr72Ec [Eurosta solidaginis]|uniref:uncharacterized protein Cpr72Ec n=1 Tax=Eurosta solidaginis TaxID=178769 RepID=UPI0035306128
MRLMLALVWVTLTTASTLRYTPTKILLAKLQSAADALDKKDQSSANTQYHEQDSDGFYSYGYSAGRSAKAEYITVDGSSHGFYSYIDANGKLQIVKYEAGPSQGFKAAATNLPKAPTNPNIFGPLPVRDTPEVQEAKKAHFEAYREAELREAIAASQNEATRYEEVSAEQSQQQQQQKSERGQQEVSEILENTRSKILAILSENGNAQDDVSVAASAESNVGDGSRASGSREEPNNGTPQEQQEEEVENADDDENAGLLSVDNLQISNESSREANEAEENSSSDRENITLENAEGQNEAENSAAAAAGTSSELSSSAHQMTTYKLSDLLNADDQLNTHALYTFERDDEGGGESSKDLLRLSELQEKSDLNFAAHQQLSSAAETVSVPVHSYYTVLAPRNKYTVITPQTHQLVPRDEARKRGHSLPISISSSYLSQRLKNMQVLIYLSALLALVAADGYYYETPASLQWSSLTPTHQYQYHTQDGFGQYSYGYGEPLSTKQEVRTLDGVTRGFYTYLDGAGKLQNVAYTADANGFRVSASNLPQAQRPTDAAHTPTTTTTTATIDVPQPVQETAEVAAARIQHLAAHEQAKLRLYQIKTPTIATQTSATKAASSLTLVKKVGESEGVGAGEKRIERVDQLLLPQSVVDTPEVAAAKAEFFKRYEEVKQRDDKLRQQQEQIAGYALVKSQPLTATKPFGSYHPAFTPNGSFRYGVVVPPNSPEYLPISAFNF